MVLIIAGRLLGLLSQLAPQTAARFALGLTRRTRRAGAKIAFGRELARYRLGGGEVVLHARRQCGGPRVLLVHGWNAAAQDWEAMAQALALRGLDVFAVDLPGHGATRGRESSLPRFVRALERVEREHGPFDAWIGHSMGASAALTLLARGASARRLVLIGPLVRPAWALHGFARSFGLSPRATEAYLHAIEHSEQMRLSDVDGERNAAKVNVPALLVHDVEDKVTPMAHVEALLGALPAGRLLRTRGLGHRRLLADAEVAREVAEFVAAA